MYKFAEHAKYVKQKLPNKNLPNQIFEIDDLVKAVNAWVQSAFGNVLSSDEKNIGHYAA